MRRNFGIIIALMVGYNLSGTLVISNYASDILADSTRKLPVVIGLVQLAGLLSGASLTDQVRSRPISLGSTRATAARTPVAPRHPRSDQARSLSLIHI